MGVGLRRCQSKGDPRHLDLSHLLYRVVGVWVSARGLEVTQGNKQALASNASSSHRDLRARRGGKAFLPVSFTLPFHAAHQLLTHSHTTRTDTDTHRDTLCVKHCIASILLWLPLSSSLAGSETSSDRGPAECST